jgi:hypothetical protein
MPWIGPTITAGAALLGNERSNDAAADLADEGYAASREGMKYGNELDMKNQRKMFRFRIKQGLKHGMTPYEMFMGPAAGAGGGTTGSGATLGNAASQQAVQQAEIQHQSAQQQMQIIGNLAATKMQNDTQKEVAEITTGQQKKELEQRKVEYENIHLPKAAAELKISAEELKISSNNAVMSTPKNQWQKIMYQMGPDNVMQSMIMEKYDVRLGDGSVENLSPEEFGSMMIELIGTKSHLRAELSGLKSGADNAWEAFLKKLVTQTKQMMSDLYGDAKQYISDFEQELEDIPGYGMIQNLLGGEQEVPVPHQQRRTGKTTMGRKAYFGK